MFVLGTLSVSDVVKRFNGIVLKDYGGIGGLKTVAIRGMGAEHTAISYDGIMVSNVQSGQVDIGRFALDNVSIISLSIGQSDDIFQSAKAFASVGTLNLETAAPHFTSHTYKGAVKATVGSFGLFNPAIEYAQKLNKTFSVTLNGSWQRADGNYPFTQDNDKLITDRKRKNSDVDIYRTELNLYSDFGNAGQLKTKLYYYDSERGLPGSVILGNDYAAERLWDKNFFIQSSYRKRIAPKLDFKSHLKYDNYRTRYENTQASGKTVDKYKEQEVYFSGGLLYAITDKISASFVEDLFYNSLDSEFTLYGDNLPYPERYSSLSALAAQYRTKRLTITSSLLMNYTSEKVKNNQPDNTYKKLLPTVSLSYEPFRSIDFRIRASYKHGFRIPTFTELYYSSVQKKLNPELAKQTNLGITWVKAFSSVPLSYINLSIDGYYNRVDDKLIIIPQTFLARTENIGKVDIKGIDIKLAANVLLSSVFDLDLSGAYSYMDALNKTDVPKDSYNDQLPYTPKHSGSFSATINNPYVSLSYSIIFSGKRYSRIPSGKEYRVDGFSDHSISLYRKWQLKRNTVYIQGGIANIWDKNYDVIKYYPMPGRSFNLSAGFKF